MCPVMIINNALWLIIRGASLKGDWQLASPPLLFKRSLFNQLAPDLLGTLVSLSAPTQWVDPYGKKGWVFQTPFRYGLTPSVSQVKAYLDYRGMSASRAMSATVYLSIFHIDQAAITVFSLLLFSSCRLWTDWTIATQTSAISNQLSSLCNSV